MQKKGQVAIEYLSTWGWALLVLVIVMGVMISGGFLNPTYIVSEECNVGTSFSCSFSLSGVSGSPARVSMQLQNGFPYRISVERLTFFDSVFGESRPIAEYAQLRQMESGDKFTFSADFMPSAPYSSFTAGQTKRLGIIIVYRLCAPEISSTGCSSETHTIYGRAVTRPL